MADQGSLRHYPYMNKTDNQDEVRLTSTILHDGGIVKNCVHMPIELVLSACGDRCAPQRPSNLGAIKVYTYLASVADEAGRVRIDLEKLGYESGLSIGATKRGLTFLNLEGWVASEYEETQRGSLRVLATVFLTKHGHSPE